MTETTITIPQDKAQQLQQLAKLSATSLKKLSDKLLMASPKRIQEIENKINTYASFI